MGTDIHAAVEVERGGVWRCVPAFGNWQLPLDRNYELFAVLAGVRNGTGFGGCQIFDPLVPLAAGRGMPPNISDEAREACDGDHSDTWISLRELESIDLKMPVRHYGWVDASEFAAFIRFSPRKAPRACSGDVFGVNVRKISNAQMKKEVLSGEAPSSTYTRVTWREELRMCAPQIEGMILKTMRDASDGMSPDNVRLVMNFDS